MSRKKKLQAQKRNSKPEIGRRTADPSAQAAKPLQARAITSGFKLWTLLVVLGLTSIALSPILNNDFINFDDPQYVTENPAIQKLDQENVKQFFTQQFVGNYQPIVMLSYSLQYYFFGPDAAGFHFISLLFHLLNTALVFVIVYHLLKNNTSAVFVALLFGVHPLHVESVAWVAAQKDVLYTFFFLGSIYFYLKEKETQGNRYKFLLPGLLFFIISVLCKAQAVVLPLILLLIDYWQKRSLTLKLVMQKIPYFIIAVAFGFLAVLMQKKAGAVQDYGYFTVVERILFSSFGFINYLWQTIFPIKLSIFYPYPETNDKINSNWVYAAPFIVLVFAALVFWLRKRSPITLFGVLFFCINIALVIQLIPVGDAIHADRYTYISLIGFFIIGGFYFGKYFEAHKNSRTLLTVLGVAYFILMGTMTFNQSGKWKDSLSIYTASLANHNAAIMYSNRSVEYFKLGNYQEFYNDINQAILLNPRFPNVYKNRALAYEKLGDPQKAIADYTVAMTYNPNDITLYLFRGNCYKTLNQVNDAIKDYSTVLEKDPNNIDAYSSRSEVYGRSGKLNESLSDLNKVIAMNPNLDGAHNNKGIVNSMLGNFSVAIIDFTKAIELNPKLWNAYYNRSLAYQKVHDYKNAYKDAVMAKKNAYPVDDAYLKQLEEAIK